MRLVIISGMSGSGKSVALHAMEDSGFYCVDNLPPELLLPFIEVERQHQSRLVAIAVDARSANSLPLSPLQINTLKRSGVEVSVLFLDASDATLMRRFSETRRKHPLTRIAGKNQDQDLRDAVALERELLADFRSHAHVIDTTMTHAAQLRSHIRALMALPQSHITLVFESFGFKRGTPTDADFVFDVRMLPNPYYEPALRPLTGRDAPVIDYLEAQPEVGIMHANIRDFMQRWLPALAENHRSYVTVAIGCTGGQHRSVYLVERLYQDFCSEWTCLRRHRDQDF